MKEKIDVFEFSPHILKSLKKGVLLTTQANGHVNSMVISWGTLGIEWNKVIFTVFVRENRFTKALLEQNPEFTINIPLDSFNKDIISVCGTQSGHDMDKIKTLGLTLESPEQISVPGIKELPLTLECKVIYKQPQHPDSIPADYQTIFYPQHVNSSFHGANKDYHTAFYGEIVQAYIIK